MDRNVDGSKQKNVLYFRASLHSIRLTSVARFLRRITLTTSASALLGLNPSKDPFLIAVIASFSLGHLSKVSK